MHFLVFLLLLGFTHQGKGEELHVIQTKGNIIVKKTGQILKKGDKIRAEEVIEFKPSDAKALVISSQRGTLILQRPQLTTKKDSELIYMVKSSLLSSNGVFGTRNGPISSLTELKSLLNQSPVLILDTVKISINTQAIPLSQDQYFFVRYMLNQQAINKKLGYHSPYVFLDRSIFLVDGQKVPTDSCHTFTLYYRDEKKKESVTATRFFPLFPDIDTLNSEAALIISVLQKGGKSSEQIKNEVRNFIFEVYGKPSEEDFSSWIQQLL